MYRISEHILFYGVPPKNLTFSMNTPKKGTFLLANMFTYKQDKSKIIFSSKCIFRLERTLYSPLSFWFMSCFCFPPFGKRVPDFKTDFLSLFKYCTINRCILYQVYVFKKIL